MVKERRGHGVVPGTPRRTRSATHLSFVPPEVGIIPGNRFFLLPLKKVSALVRHHRCRGSSATSTKSCIIQKAAVSSRSAPLVLHSTAPSNRVVLQTGQDLKNLCPAVCPSNLRLTKRGSRKQRHQRPATVKSLLSPVSEQEQEEVLFVSETVLDQGCWNRGSKLRPLQFTREEKKITGLRNASDKGSARFHQFNLERAQNEQRINNEISKAERRPKRRSTVAGNNLCREDGVHQQRVGALVHIVQQEENSRRLDTHHAVISRTRNDDLSVVFPIDKNCGNESTVLPGASLREMQKLLFQQSGHVSSGLMDSGVNVTNCNGSGGGLHSRLRSKNTTIMETRLSRHLEQHQQRVVDYKSSRGAVHGDRVNNRICKIRRGSPRVFDQSVVAKDRISCIHLSDELQKEDVQARFNVMRSCGHAVEKPLATLKQVDMLRGRECTVDGHQRRRASKKLRKVVPRIRAFRRSTVSPSTTSWPLGHGAQLQVESNIDHQFLLPPQLPKNSIQLWGDYDRCEVRKSRDEVRLADQFGGTVPLSCSAVQKRTTLKGFLCSFSSEDDLPIGPLIRKRP